MRVVLIVGIVGIISVFVAASTVVGQPRQSAIIAIPMGERTDRDFLESLRLPVYHEFDGALVAEVTHETVIRLIDAKVPFTVLDDVPGGLDLYLVAPRKQRTMPATISGCRTLWGDQTVRLVRALDRAALSGNDDLSAVALSGPIGVYSAVRYTSGTLVSAARDSLLMSIVAEVNADSIRAVIQALQDFGTRYAYATNRDTVSRWIRDRFLSLGYTDAVVDSFQVGGSWQWNALATLTGTIHPDELVVIGGHHDSYAGSGSMTSAPGADDNASGTAAVLEIARVLKKKGVVPEFTIKFATFAAEEIGLIGGQIYANRLKSAGAKVALMVNHDMISNDPRSPGSQIMDINWYTGSEGYRDLAIQIARRVCTVTPVVGSQNSGGSDSHPFWSAGYPAVYFEENSFSPYYHTSSDVVSKYNMAYCAQVIRASCALVLTRASAPSAVAALKVEDQGNGHALRVNWTPSAEPDLAGYVVYRGTSTGVYDTSFATTSTDVLLDGLTEGVRYVVGISAIDVQGFESPVTERQAIPLVVPLMPSGLTDDPQRHSVALHWSPNSELDLEGYHVYRATDTTQLPSRLTTSVVRDTAFSDASVLDGVRYFYALTAVDSGGIESVRSPYIRSSAASLNQGVLVVDETKKGTGALLSPTEDEVDGYYRGILSHFAATTIDADSMGGVKFADLGPFSSVLWHGNDLSEHTAATRSRDGLKRYLEAGGKLFLTSYSPALTFLAGGTYPANFAAGTFTYDWLKISHAENKSLARCIGATPVASGYPALRIDTTKTPATAMHHLLGIEGSSSAPGATVIYSYETAYDTSVVEGKMKGQPVGIEYVGADYSLVVTSLPLYYVRSEDARALAEFVLGSRFGEPNGVQGTPAAVPTSTALLPNYPNPFNPVTVIRYSIASSQENGVGSRETKLVVYDLLGREVVSLVNERKTPGTYEVKFDGSGLSSGVYFYRLTAGAYVESRRMILMK
jgi:hypothetical protein